MTTIRHLAIRGIRSFGESAEDEQKITFESPLTLILGENGSGKTTIIECLKYATTGDPPPGTGVGGQQFVHDLKLAKADMVYGQVKLEVRDVFGKSTTITRAIKKESKGKQGKVTCKSIDAAISVVTPDGKKTQRSLRIGDATMDMIRTMGVSKAVLSNVIFCHQEESCWPFSSDKELKEKFDQIFGTAEYIKAVDALAKRRKEMTHELNRAKDALRYTSDAKNEVDRKKLKLLGNEANLETFNKEYAELETELAPIKERLIKLREVEMEYSKIYNQKVKVDTALKGLRKREDASRKKIRDLFEGDIDALKREIEDFELKKENMNSKRTEAETDVKTYTNDLRTIEERCKEIERKLARLQTEKEQEQETFAKRAEEVKKACERFSIPVQVDLDNDNNAAGLLIDQIKDAVKLEDDSLAQVIKSNEEAEAQHQTKIDKLREERAGVDSEVVAKNKLHTQVSAERSKIAQDVARIEASQSQVESILHEIKKCEEQLETLKQDLNIEEKKREIMNKSKVATELQDEVEQLDTKINDLRELTRQLNEINYKEKEIKKYEETFSNIYNKHSSNLKTFFGDTLPESNFKQQLNAKYRLFESESNEINTKIKKLNHRVVELKTTRKTQRDRLSKMERELKDAQDTLFNVCGDDDYEEMVAKTSEKIQKLQLDFGAIKSSEALYKKYIAQMKEDVRCPLCQVAMEEDTCHKLSTDLEEEIDQLPDKIKTTEKLLKTEQKTLDQLQKIRGKVDSIARLKPEIQALEEQSKTSEEELKQLQAELEDLELTVVEPAQNAKTANSMLPDMSQLDTQRNHIERLKREVEKIRNELPADKQAESPDELVKLKLEKQKQVKQLRGDLEQARSFIDGKAKQITDATEKKNKLLEKKNELQEGTIALPEKRSRLEELNKQRDELEPEIVALKTKSVNLRQQLDNANREKKDLKDRHTKTVKDLRKKLAESTAVYQSLQRLNEAVLDFARRDLDTTMEDTKKNLEMRNEELELKRKQVTHHQDKLNEIKEQIANFDNKKRDLEENLDLKQILTEIEEKAKDFAALEVETEKTNYKELKTEQDALKKKEDGIVSKRSNIAGKKSQLETELKSQRAELEKPKYVNAFRNYYTAFHKQKIIEAVMADLDLYRKALDYSLTKFHQEKMFQINESIRGMWRDIYRGNDIDYVEIRAEEPNVSNTSKRRNYDYHVIQCKNGVEMEMRGRCSAGQKVLASLIIRLALAETFSSDCKVMTLDEPTTNLDEANVASLCEALGRIINENIRKGMMLIIITHDEHFLQVLRPHLVVGYRIYRNRDGKSVIGTID